MIKMVGNVYKILGKNRLRALGFDISKGKPTRQQAVILNKAEEEMPSTSDVLRRMTSSSKKLRRMWKEARRISSSNSRENPLWIYPMCELLDLDKQFISIRGLLRVEVAKKV